MVDEIRCGIDAVEMTEVEKKKGVGGRMRLTQ